MSALPSRCVVTKLPPPRRVLLVLPLPRMELQPLTTLVTIAPLAPGPLAMEIALPTPPVVTSSHKSVVQLSPVPLLELPMQTRTPSVLHVLAIHGLRPLETVLQTLTVEINLPVGAEHLVTVPLLTPTRVLSRIHVSLQELAMHVPQEPLLLTMYLTVPIALLSSGLLPRPHVRPPPMVVLRHALAGTQNTPLEEPVLLIRAQ